MTENLDANTDEYTGDTETVETGSSPAVNYEPIEEDGFVSTTEFKEVEVDSEDENDGGDTPEKQDKPDSEKQDFSQHPRFQELIKEKNELKQRLARLESAKPKQAAQKKGPQPKYKFQNIMAMDNEAIVDEFTNNPKQFLANYAQQMAHELTMDMQKEQQQKMQQYKQHMQQRKSQMSQQKSLKTMQNFFQDKDDGIQMLQDGSIAKYMQENPGHNPISAYHALAGEQHYQTKLQSELKKEKAKILKQLKAAGKAAPVRGETATRSYADRTPAPAKNKADLKQSMLKRLLDSQ